MKIITALTDSLHRLQPHTPMARGRAFAIAAARGEQVSAQLALRVEGDDVADVAIAAEADDGLSVRVRRVGYVPVAHYNGPRIEGHYEGDLPGYVGDVLLEETAGRVWPRETHAYWLTVKVSPSCRPGARKVRVTATVAGQAFSHELSIRVADVQVGRRKDFPVTNWFYADALLDYYRLRPFEARFWPILEAYIRNMAGHGQDTLYVPAFTPPLDGVKRPTQLLKVRRAGAGRYEFDWSDVRRYIRLARRCGMGHLEFNHLFTQWGAKHAIRIYHGQGQDERLLWPAETPADSPVYERFLAQYLPALHAFCRREGILEQSLFHVSDEPNEQSLANYTTARGILRRLAPWMRVMDALSRFEYAPHVDMPIPSIDAVSQFLHPAVGEPMPCWTYFCCAPRGRFLQRQMDTPLSKTRMAGWLFYRTGVKGFLHWGYNYWYRSQTRQMIDPYTISDGLAAPGWAYGDTFMVYPGPEGPVDSVRHEVFAESLQDYALLQTLNVPRDGRLLAELRGYDDFPFSPKWISAARARLLR